MPRVTRRALLTVFAIVPVGAIAGVVWWQLADPSSWRVTSAGLSLGEEASRGRFQVVLVFVLVGLIASLAWGLVAGLLLRDLGWPVAALVGLGSLLMAVVAWRVGVHLGPPPPEQATGVSVGDTVPDELVIDGIAPFLAWPIGGLLAVTLASLGGPRRPDYDADEPDETDAVEAEVAATRS